MQQYGQVQESVDTPIPNPRASSRIHMWLQKSEEPDKDASRDGQSGKVTRTTTLSFSTPDNNNMNDDLNAFRD